MRYIAIIKEKNIGCYDCGEERLIASVTDWKEVTEEEFALLSKAANRSWHYKSKIPPFSILERPLPSQVDSFVSAAIEDYLALLKKEEEDALLAKKRRAATVEKNKEARALKAKEVATKKLEKLRKELAELEQVAAS